MEGALPTIKMEEIKKEEDCDEDVKPFDDGGVFSALSSDCKVETDSTARPVSQIPVPSGDLMDIEVKVVKEEDCESLIQLASTMLVKCEAEETPLQANVKTEDGGHVKTEEFKEESADNPPKDKVGDQAMDKNHKCGTEMRPMNQLTKVKFADILRAEARERMRRVRREESAEAAEKRRATERDRMRRRRQELSAEALDKWRARARERMRQRRQEMSAEDVEKRRAAQRERMRRWREDSSPDTVNKRRIMERDKTRLRRMNETPEQADARRLKEKKRSQERRDKALLHRNKKKT